MAKLHVITNDAGDIIALAPYHEGSFEHGQPSIGPVHGQFHQEVEAPDDIIMGESLLRLAQSHRIDRTRYPVRLVARGTKQQ